MSGFVALTDGMRQVVEQMTDGRMTTPVKKELLLNDQALRNLLKADAAEKLTGDWQ